MLGTSWQRERELWEGERQSCQPDVEESGWAVQRDECSGSLVLKLFFQNVHSCGVVCALMNHC